jgi:hypothetical protein
MEFLQNCLEQTGLTGRSADHRLDRQHPGLAGGQSGAFYRIFLGHQQHAVLGESQIGGA